MKPFLDILGSQQIGKTLKNIKDSNVELFCWELINDVKFLTKIQIEAILHSKKNFTFSTDGPDRHQITKKDRLYFYCPDRGYVFDAVRAGEAVEFPAQISFVEKRKSERFRLDDHPIKLSFQTFKMVSGYLFDVSLGGCSVVVNEIEARPLVPGDLYGNSVIQFSSFNLGVDLKLVSKAKIEPSNENNLFYAGVKLSFEFQELERDELKFLANYIFHHFIKRHDKK